MKITLEKILMIIESDDNFIVNIKNNGKTIYFGYNENVPDTIKNLILKDIYIDWDSKALGIEVY